MTYLGEKHWDLHVSEHALLDVVEPVLAEFYDDGPLPRDLPGLLFEGQHANAWHYERDGSESLALLRARVIADHLSQICSYCDVFTHDPDAGDGPIVDRAEMTDALTKRFAGSHDRKPLMRDWPVTDPHLAPLVAATNLDDFARGIPTARVIGALVTAVADALEDGRVEVDASEPYDSCRGCGGYHNVNYDCTGYSIDR